MATRTDGDTTRAACLAGILLAGLSATLLGCDSGERQNPQVGSDTNWLVGCVNGAQCEVGVCRCGVCTLACETPDDCTDVDGAMVCLEVGELSTRSCRLGFPGTTAGVCTRNCLRDADCSGGDGGGTRCVEGVCLPVDAVTPHGTVGELPGGTGIPATDASTGAGTDAGTNPGADAEVPAPGQDAASASPEAGQLGGSVLTTPGGSIELPTPKPQCPCESDAPPEGATVLPGEAPANDYGRPAVPTAPDETSWQGRCQEDVMELPWWFELDDPCVRYSLCPLPCEADDDCPGGGSGTASPRCASSGACFLDCRDGRSCPEGMACVSGSDGAACYWPFEVLLPECDAYCRQRPVPRECAAWCADLLVACDPSAGVNCCEGLTCNGAGFCDASP